jgi:hypothetical protein
VKHRKEWTSHNGMEILVGVEVLWYKYRTYGSKEAQLVLYLISVLASSGGPGSVVGIATA